MSSLAIGRAYCTRAVWRNLDGARRRRTHRWRRCHRCLVTSSSVARAPFGGGRGTPLQPLYYFSSVSTRDDDDDAEPKNDGDGDADAHADSELGKLWSKIARLKKLDEKLPSRDGGDDGAPDVDPTTDPPGSELLDVMSSSPFEPSPSPSLAETATSSASSPPQNEFNPSGATNDAADVPATTKPSLSELLRTDIFSDSWAEPDAGGDSSSDGGEDSSSFLSNGTARRRGGGDGCGGIGFASRLSGINSHGGAAEGARHARGTSPRSPPSYQSHADAPSSGTSSRPSSSPWDDAPPTSWPSSSRRDGATFDDAAPPPTTTASWDDDSFSEPSYPQQQTSPSPAEERYNEILAQTDELLESLSKDDDSPSTLQLTDFDEVMARWSRFHSEADVLNNEGSFAASDQYAGGDDGENQALKQKASAQCTRLLDALEHNHDRILHHSSRSEGGAWREEEDLPRTKHSRLVPNAASYNLALHALAHSERGAPVAQEAIAMLARMLDRCRRFSDAVREGDEGAGTTSATPPPEPTVITYNSVLHAVAKSGARDAGHFAEEAFARMEGWRERCAERDGCARRIDYDGVLPNARTLACVLDAWASAKTAQQQSFAPERAEAILDLAVERRLTYVDAVMGRVREEEGSFEGEEEEEEERVLFIDEDGGVEEEDVVDEEPPPDDEAPLMPPPRATAESAPPLPQPAIDAAPLRPNTVAFNTVIHAWASSGRGREGALRAEELLNRLEALSESGELDLPGEIVDDGDGPDDMDSSSLRPNVRTYSLVMNAWSNASKSEGGASGEEAASRCEAMLERMETRGADDASTRPNLVSYVTAISAWARADGVAGAASRAEHILNRMIDLNYAADTDSDAGRTTGPSASLEQLEGDALGGGRASHDAPFNAVITAYARSDDPYAVDRALAVLQRLEDSPVRPTATTYNSAMDCCAKHGAPERALEVMERMRGRGVAPDPVSYDTVLNAFARDDKAGSAGRAWEFLCQLEEERTSGESNFTPSSVSYATVINAFARASGTEHGGLPAVIKAREIYERLTDQMKDGNLYGRADPFANSCFLNCCANVRGTRTERKEALVIAISAFEDMKARPDVAGEPNQYTFGTMMKACIRLSSDQSEMHRLLESLFAQACKRGMLSGAVLGQFFRHVPSQLSTKSILSLGGSKREIPYSWYCNVPQKHWPTTSGFPHYSQNN